MTRPHKFRPGQTLSDPVDAVVAILDGAWLYYGCADRPTSPRSMEHMSLGHIAQAARYGRLTLAVRTTTETNE